MKRMYLWTMGLSCSLALFAQQHEKEVNLDEVVVKGARVINKADGKVFFPSQTLKEAASSGYSLLNKLALPGLYVDEISQRITALDNRGSVQIRINGIIAGKNELLTLNPKQITRIEWIDNPGVRYGEGVGYVVLIHTTRKEIGYSILADLKQGFTAQRSNNQISGTWSRGKNEWGISYEWAYIDFNRTRTTETTEYTLNNGSHLPFTKETFRRKAPQTNHIAQLKFNRSDSNRYVLQTVLNVNLNCSPHSLWESNIKETDRSYTATHASNERQFMPSLDLYYRQQLSERQSLTINTVGAYADTRSRFADNNIYQFDYAIDGKTASVNGEVIYENKLHPFTLTAGASTSYQYIRNYYSGDVQVFTPQEHSETHAFGQLNGRWKQWTYMVGMGLKHITYRQGNHHYRFWAFRPKASLAWNPSDTWQLRYDFEMNEHISRVAMITNATIRNNLMEWTRGNPDLRPNHEFTQILQISYHNNRLQTMAEAYYRINHRPNMAVYERTADNRFIYSQRNQPSIKAFQLMAYAQYWLIKKRLSWMVNGRIFNCANVGDDYKHHFTTFLWQTNLQAYWKNVSLTAYFDNGWKFLEGETRGFLGNNNGISVSWQKNNWTLSLYWLHPFEKWYKITDSKILNRYLHKHAIIYSRDYANQFVLNVSWRFQHGRTYKRVQRENHKISIDTGILKQ